MEMQESSDEEKDDLNQEEWASIENELRILRLGGESLLRERRLAGLLGERNQLAAQRTGELSRLRRFCDKVAPGGVNCGRGPGAQLLHQIESFLTSHMETDQLELLAAQSLGLQASLSSKCRELQQLKSEAEAAAIQLELEQDRSMTLEREVKQLREQLNSPTSVVAASCGSIAPTNGWVPSPVSGASEPQRVIEEIAASRRPEGQVC